MFALFQIAVQGTSLKAGELFGKHCEEASWEARAQRQCEEASWEARAQRHCEEASWETQC